MDYLWFRKRPDTKGMKLNKVRGYDYLEKAGDYYLTFDKALNKLTAVFVCPFCAVRSRADNHKIPVSAAPEKGVNGIPLTLSSPVICGNKECGREFSVINGEVIEPREQKV